MQEDNKKSISQPLSLKPNDLMRIQRMADAQERSFSAQVRFLVMPQVEAWERENGISLPDSNCQ